MGTTALFAELVVGGVLTLTWMFLLAATALGPSRFAPLLEAPPTLSAGLFLVAAYAVGVVFDRVWDILLEKIGLQKFRRKQKAMDKTELDWERKRRRVYGKDPKTTVDFVNYHRSRMRVARASVFNFTLIAASGLALLGVRYGGVETTEFALAAASGGVLCAASALALWDLGRSHNRVLEIVWDEEKEKRTSPTDAAENGTVLKPLDGEAVKENVQSSTSTQGEHQCTT